MIRVEGLWAGYGGRPVLRGLDCAVEPGEFVGILGPNACGKSTLVRVLSGVLPVQEGRVEIGGVPLAGLSPREAARTVATVPQSTQIPFPFTGFEVVLMGRYPHLGRFAREGAEDVTRVRGAMAETDTEELAERLVTEVSGGERQRLILARALAQDARVLILDEATASMDVHRKIDAFDLLERVNGMGTTVIAVMHDLNLAALYCRRLLFMADGRVAADGATPEVFTREVIEGVYRTPVEVLSHPRTEKPYAVFLPRRRG